jgi:hypothetical protein
MPRLAQTAGFAGIIMSTRWLKAADTQLPHITAALLNTDVAPRLITAALSNTYNLGMPNEQGLGIACLPDVACPARPAIIIIKTCT